MKRKKFVLPAFAAVIAAALALSAVALSAARPAEKAAPPFELQSQYGETVSLDSLKGEIVVLTFTYTRCPVACPLLLIKIMESVSRLDRADRHRVKLVAVTVDPGRDTSGSLLEYSSRLPYDWLFLTGTPGQLTTAWENYGITVRKEMSSSGGMAWPVDMDYEVSHTLKAVLIDAGRNIAAELTGDWQPEELSTDLNDMLGGRKPQQKASLLTSIGSFLYRCGPFSLDTAAAAFSHFGFMLSIPLVLFGLYRVIR